MSTIVRVGVDLAKRVIQVHAVDAEGRVVANKPLARERFAAWCVQLQPGCLDSWQWKRARELTTGAASCERWAWTLRDRVSHQFRLAIGTPD